MCRTGIASTDSLTFIEETVSSEVSHVDNVKLIAKKAAQTADAR